MSAVVSLNPQSASQPPAPPPKNLVEAKIFVAQSIKRMEKLHENKHGGYQFASIDDFKDEVRPLMAKAGLDLHVSEENYEIIEVAKKGNEKTTSAKIRFKFILTHVSGEKSEPSFFTVCMPYTGAQTSGAAQSYAIKEGVYKGLFQASSGDLNEEADLQEQVQLSNLNRLSKADAKPLYEALQHELRNIETTERSSDAVGKWWKENTEQFDMLPVDWFVMLKREYAETWKKLKAGEEADSKMGRDQ